MEKNKERTNIKMNLKEEFQSIKEELDETCLRLRELENKKYFLNSKYVKLLKKQCEENIGRCFKQLENGKTIAYCKIINIDKIENTRSGLTFNEYQYPAVWFEYPYNNSKMPFYEDNLFSAAWGVGYDAVGDINKISYEEISKEEFLERFSEINDLWIHEIGK